MGSVSYSPLGRPALLDLAAHLYETYRDNPLELTRVTVLLPTRRSVRILEDLIVKQNSGRPVVLPHIRAVGDIDDQELELMIMGLTGTPIDIPQAIPALERRIIFAQMILTRDPNTDYPRALALAQELEAFLNEIQNEHASLDRLDHLVAADYAEHWQNTLQFLNILRITWPNYLSATGKIDPAERRSRLIRALINLWCKHPPQTPVIALGISGSLPDVRDLLSIIAKLPNGHVILTGFDSVGWATTPDAFTDDQHPQREFGLLLEALGLDPASLRPWSVEAPNPLPSTRAHLWRMAFLPAAYTHVWMTEKKGQHNLSPKNTNHPALHGFDILEVDTMIDESKAIALYVHRAIHNPDHSVAIVTPDRALATTIQAACSEFNITVNDSAGTPLHQTSVGQFLDLILLCHEQNLRPVDILSLIDHPLFSTEFLTPSQRTDLEINGLRSFHPGRTISQFISTLEKRGCLKDTCVAMADILSALGLEKMAELQSISAFARWHITAAEALAKRSENHSILWETEDGEAAGQLFEDMILTDSLDIQLSFSQYASIWRNNAQNMRVNWRGVGHPRIALFGVFESRLAHATHIILAGMNEQAWPGGTDVGPWLSRSMRKDFGLPPLERLNSRIALDLFQLATNKHVLITRSKSSGRQSTQPSRWLDRLDVVLKGVYQIEYPYRNLTLTAKCEAFNEVPLLPVRPRTMPTPPLNLRPTSYSATQIEKLITDPYHFYANRILKLQKLLPYESPIDGRTRGIIVHAVLHKFISSGVWSVSASQQTKDIEYLINDVCDDLTIPEHERRNALPRLKKALQLFLHANQVWLKDGYLPVSTECDWAVTTHINDIPVRISARLDRVDQTPNGAYVIIDYKTGTSLPSRKNVALRYAPQLPIQAWLASTGQSDQAIPRRPVAQVGYWPITTRTIPQMWWSEDNKYTVSELLFGVEDGVVSMIKRYFDPATAYIPCPIPALDPGYDDYYHLSRRDEWWGVDDTIYNGKSS